MLQPYFEPEGKKRFGTLTGPIAPVTADAPAGGAPGSPAGPKPAAPTVTPTGPAPTAAAGAAAAALKGGDVGAQLATLLAQLKQTQSMLEPKDRELEQLRAENAQLKDEIARLNQTLDEWDRYYVTMKNKQQAMQSRLAALKPEEELDKPPASTTASPAVSSRTIEPVAEPEPEDSAPVDDDPSDPIHSTEAARQLAGKEFDRSLHVIAVCRR